MASSQSPPTQSPSDHLTIPLGHPLTVEDAVMGICVPIWRAIARNTVVFDYRGLSRLDAARDEIPVRYSLDIGPREEVIVDIPPHLEAHRIGLEDRWKCDIAVTIMLPILMDLLAEQHIEAQWHTADYIVKPNILYIPSDEDNNWGPWHTVIQLERKHGSIHIIDFTGSQFGLEGVLVPWGEYQKVVDPDGPVFVDRLIIDTNSVEIYGKFCQWLCEYIYNLFKVWRAAGSDIEGLVGAINDRLRNDANSWWENNW